MRVPVTPRYRPAGQPRRVPVPILPGTRSLGRQLSRLVGVPQRLHHRALTSGPIPARGARGGMVQPRPVRRLNRLVHLRHTGPNHGTGPRAGLQPALREPGLPMTKNSSTSPDPASGRPQQQTPNVSTRCPAHLELSHHLHISGDLTVQLAGSFRPVPPAATRNPTRAIPAGQHLIREHERPGSPIHSTRPAAPHQTGRPSHQGHPRSRTATPPDQSLSPLPPVPAPSPGPPTLTLRRRQPCGARHRYETPAAHGTCGHISTRAGKRVREC